MVSSYMLLRSEFVFLDYEESRLAFLLAYLALMGLCIFIAHYSAKSVRKVDGVSPDKRKAGIVH